MIVETLLAFGLALSLAQADARDRLADAVRDTRLEDAEAALSDLLLGDPVRAARALASSLPRSRDRQVLLLKATVGARVAYDNIDGAIGFNIQEQKVKSKALEQAKARIKQACALALDGEKIYELLMESFRYLPAAAGPVLAEEAERAGSWLHKCELLEGLGKMGAGEHLLPALEREKEQSVVLAAAVHGLSSPKAAAPYLSHPQWQVRLSALHGLGRERGAVGPLVEALGGAEIRLRNGIFGRLSGLTETELPPDAGVWQDWWKANRESFLAGTYLPSARKELPGPGRTTFYDVPIWSSRVCFVIDRSRSMREQNRFETAKKELLSFLDALPDGALVNVVFFGGTQTCMSGSSRLLDRQGRRDAADFIERQNMEPSTDLYGALEKALTFTGSAESGRLREDGLDTIVVLSDGQATTGRLIDDDLVARVISRRARYLRPVIHTVSLSVDARSLRLLSERTGGQYRVK